MEGGRKVEEGDWRVEEGARRPRIGEHDLDVYVVTAFFTDKRRLSVKKAVRSAAIYIHARGLRDRSRLIEVRKTEKDNTRAFPRCDLEEEISAAADATQQGIAEGALTDQHARAHRLGSPQRAQKSHQAGPTGRRVPSPISSMPQRTKSKSTPRKTTWSSKACSLLSVPQHRRSMMLQHLLCAAGAGATSRELRATSTTHS